MYANIFEWEHHTKHLLPRNTYADQASNNEDCPILCKQKYSYLLQNSNILLRLLHQYPPLSSKVMGIYLSSEEP